MYFWLGLVMAAASTALTAYEVVLKTPDGEFNVVNVPAEEPLSEFLESIRLGYGEETVCIVDVRGDPQQELYRKAVSYRQYEVPLTSSQRKDISYIVNTLGTASLVKIAKERSSLKKAGDRLDQIHPLHFVAAIFSDEEMKSSIQALKNRGWIWSDFFEGINKSMTEEHKNHNVLPYVDDFAARLNLSSSLILPALESGNWKEFVNILIEKVPRSKNTNRYQMQFSQE